MKITNFVITSWLVVFSLAGSVYAQAGLNSIFYHWVTQNEVILWQSLADDKPVTAVFSPSEEKWRIEPIQAAGAWRPILERIIRNYHQGRSFDALTDDQLWGFALATLRNEYKSVKWARPRNPEVEVYLLPKGEQEVEAVFYVGLAGQTKPEIVQFIRKDGKWTKQQDLNLNKLFGLTPKSEELRKVLDIPDTQLLPKTIQEWAEVWNHWIRSFILTDRAIQHVMYQTVNGQLRWVWRERLNLRAALPSIPRQMPTTLPNLKIPVIEDVPVQTQSAESSWSSRAFRDIQVVVGYLLYLFSFVVGVGATVLWFKLRHRIQSSTRLQKLAARWKWLEGYLTTQPEVQVSALPITTIELLHKIALHRCQENHNTDINARDVLLSSLHWVYQEYCDIAASKQLLQEISAYKEEITKEFLRRDLKAGENTEQIKRWIKIGRAAEQVPQVESLIIPNEVINVVNGQIKASSLSQNELLLYWPQLIIAFDQCLRKRNEDFDKLNLHLNKQEEKYQNDVKTLKAGLKGRVKDLVEDLKNKNKNLEEECKQRSRDLEVATEKIANLNAEITRTQNASSTLSVERKTMEDSLAIFQQKLMELQEVRLLSRSLRQWLQGYYEQRWEQHRDIKSVALLTSLINFSLCQMCFSISEDRPSLRKVLAHNIFRFTQRFDRSTGNVSDFALVHRYLFQLSPEVEKTLKEFQNAELGGDTLDTDLFRGFLNQLRLDTGINLSPFFIDVDKRDKTLVYVNVS